MNKDKVAERKNHVLTIIVVAFGLLLTLLMTLASYYLVDIIEESEHEVRLIRFGDEVSEQFNSLTRFLGPLIGAVDIDSDPKRENILQSFNEAQLVLKTVEQKPEIKLAAFVPNWVGQAEKDFNDIQVSQKDKLAIVSSFIEENLSDWTFHLSQSTFGNPVLLGLDGFETDEISTFVFGYPIFESQFSIQQDNSLGQLPAGFALVWTDIDEFLQESVSSKGFGQEDFTFCILSGSSSRYCIDFDKGEINVTVLSSTEEVLMQSPIRRVYLAGRDVSFTSDRNSALDDQGWAKIHIFIALFGVLASFGIGYIFYFYLSRKNTSQTNALLKTKNHSNKAGPQVERVIRTNKARWDYVMDNLPIALFAINENATFTWAEGRGLRILGMNDAPLEGQSALHFFEQNEKIVMAIKSCLEGHAQQSVFAIKGAWIDIRLSPVLKNDGDFNGLIGMASDVSEEYMVRGRLDKANMHLQSLMDNLPNGVAFIRDGVIEWCSRKVEETLGYEDDELNGRSPEIIYDDPTRFKEIGQKARKVIHQGLTYQGRIKCRKKDGARFFAEITGNLVDPSSPPSGSIWVLNDLTDNLKEEREKRLSQAVYDNLIEGIIVTDENNQIVSVNKAFSLITGYEFEEVIGLTPHVLSSGRHDEAFFEKMWQSINESGFWRGEFWNRRKSGETYLQNAMITCLKDENGNVQQYVAVFNDITRDRQNQEQLLYQTNYDMLTGLPNRHLLADRFHQAVAWAKREEKNFAVVYLDLDNFKYHNESFGHENGDYILKVLAERISNKIREFDTVARIGGDEFVLLLMDADEQDEITRIIATLSFELSHPIKLPHHKDELILSATCGIAQYPKDGDTLAELSRKADSALYHAKETERGIFMFFTEEMNKRARERVKLENRLRKAIESDEFVLFFQPKVDLVTGEIHGAESLIRWIDPEMGLIGPDRFIPIAEETGQIVPIGEWVFKTACLQMKQWQDQGLKIKNLAINLSGRQFLKPDLVEGMLQTIEEIGVDPTSLELEITESFIANSEQTTTDALERLSSIGVKLSVDDFGTGYSSLSYLHRFPLDIMKIDRSFIIDIDDQSDPETGKIAKAVIAIAKSMNLDIVGEGVENDQQLKFLRKNGCDLIQGYYFSKPLPGEEFEKLVRSGKTLYS